MKLMKSLVPTALAMAALIGLNSVEARAGSITQTQSIGQTALPLSTNFNFNGYAGAPGTLTSVDLTVTVTVNGQIIIRNFSSDTFHVDSATINAIVTATSPAGNTVVNASGGVGPVDIAPSAPTFQGTIFNNVIGTDSTTSSYTGAQVNPFYGAPVSIPVGLTSNNGTVGGSPLDANISYGGSLTAAVSVELTYNYVAVPEPTSSAMFGIGIVLAVGLGWGRRRRELNKLAA